jgi:hypothetical protein
VIELTVQTVLAFLSKPQFGHLFLAILLLQRSHCLWFFLNINLFVFVINYVTTIGALDKIVSWSSIVFLLDDMG